MGSLEKNFYDTQKRKDVSKFAKLPNLLECGKH